MREERRQSGNGKLKINNRKLSLSDFATVSTVKLLEASRNYRKQIGEDDQDQPEIAAEHS
jgi:hypothetical protein